MYKFANPKTFKYKLWKHLNLRDLRDENNKYAKVAWDISLIPLLEMAGIDRVQFIPDIFYKYNKHDKNDSVLYREEQIKFEKYFRGKQPYKLLETL